MLLDTLGASLLWNIWAGKGAIATGQGRGINRAGEWAIAKSISKKTKSKRQDQGVVKEFIMLPHRLTSFETQKCYQNQTRFNKVCFRNDLSKINDGAYVINYGEYSDIQTHWIALYVLNNNFTFLDSFGLEHIPKEIKAFVGNENIKTIFLEYNHMIQ